MKGPKDAAERRDFIWKKDSNAWHLDRGEQIRKKYGDKIAQLEGPDPTSLIYFALASLSHWLVAVAVGSWFSDRYWTAALLGWWLGGFWAVSAGLAMHECAHQLVFRGRWPAFAAGVIGQLPLFVPAYKVFQFYHLPHHSYVTIEPEEANKKEAALDPNRKPLYDLDLPTEFEARLFSGNCLTRALFLFLQVFMYAFRPMIVSPKPLYLEDVIGFVTQALYIWSATQVGGTASFIYLLASAWLGSGLHVSAIHFVAEHYLVTAETAHTSDASKCLDTFSYYGPINYVLWNGGYHVEHHDFPRVPWRHLPRLRELAPEFYDPLPHHTSYVAVMLRFIFDHEGLWQRVKRTEADNARAEAKAHK